MSCLGKPGVRGPFGMVLKLTWKVITCGRNCLNARLRAKDCILVYRFLGSLGGGQKKASQQKEMATDLSKFLHFSSPDKIDINNSVKMKCVEDYVEELQRRTIGPSGIISKLNTLCFAQTFIVQR